MTYIQDSQATITVDSIVENMFSPLPFLERPKGLRTHAGIVAEIQITLQDKGDDPRYERVVFAGDQTQGFRYMTTSDVRLEGVFLRDSSVGQHYEGRVIPNIFGAIKKETLVVATTEEVAQQWATDLQELGYTVKRV